MSKKLYAVDWSHTEEKLRVMSVDSKKWSSKLPEPSPDIVLITENMPINIARPYLEAGTTVLRCTPNASAEMRKKLNYEKTDDNDVFIIFELYRRKPNIFRPMRPPSKLKQLAINYHQLAYGTMPAIKNRFWHAEDDDNKAFLDDLERTKNNLRKMIEVELKNYPIYTQFLSKIKGVGPALAAMLIGNTEPIDRFDNHSNLCSYFGLTLDGDGKARKRKKGEVANWNAQGKSLICELIPDQFIKHRTPVYREIYDEEKAKQIAILEKSGHNGWKGHAERRARRKVGKIFLHHFWKEWRILEGLPVPQPWVLEHGGHSKEILPPTAYEGLSEEAA